MRAFIVLLTFMLSTPLFANETRNQDEYCPKAITSEKVGEVRRIELDSKNKKAKMCSYMFVVESEGNSKIEAIQNAQIACIKSVRDNSVLIVDSIDVIGTDRSGPEASAAYTAEVVCKTKPLN